MPTVAQIEANRANAQKSTGPRTEAGKARSRLNALKHGLRAADAPAVLPHEDAAELAGRVQQWVDDYQPANAIERELVARAARASWALDRAERHEAALLSRRVRKAMLRNRAKRTARACVLGRKLLSLAGGADVLGPTASDDPAALVAALEESPEGARWLVARWRELRALIDSDQRWTFLDQFKLVRLLGKQPCDAVDDPDLNALFLAWEVIEPEWGVRFWLKMRESTSRSDPAFNAWRLWREIAPRPADAAAAVALLRGTVESELARLDDLIADLDAAEGDDAAELAESASFSASDAAERLRRHQSARSRELIRAVEALARLRKESAAAEKSAAKKSPNEPIPILAEPTASQQVASNSARAIEPDRSRPKAASRAERSPLQEPSKGRPDGRASSRAKAAGPAVERRREPAGRRRDALEFSSKTNPKAGAVRRE